VIDACDECLRRAYLLGELAPRLATLLARRDHDAPPVLGLSEKDFVAAVAGPRREDARRFLDRLDLDAAREQLAAGRFIAVCPHADAYPALLQPLADPPAVLFGLGMPDALDLLRDEPAVAIVGSRSSSGYGTEVAYALGRGLGAAGVPVVSGLALGIDATAHRGCLEGGGVPIAVLACGPDVVYPRRHRQLHESVRAAGLVLAELPPGTRPFRWSFPARNRIMAGLTRMTVVVEAAQPSGSLITSEFAKDLGRSVAAVPGRITSNVARGTNSLLKDGAVPITGPGDVLDELFGVGMRTVPEAASAPARPDDPSLRSVLEAAARSPSVDDMARATCLSIAEVRAALGRLELDGHLVRREVGGWEVRVR